MSDKPGRPVSFQGIDLWFLEGEDGTGPLAPLEHCDDQGNFKWWCFTEDSFAHVIEGGIIKRYGREIGTVSDLVPRKVNP
jgi:hypothetical protein